MNFYACLYQPGLPSDLVFDLTNLEVVAKDNLNEAQQAEFPVERLENIPGKRENGGYHYHVKYCTLKPLLNDKILNWSKLKAFADDKIKLTETLKFVLGRVKNILGKGDNAGCQCFLLFPQWFQKASYTGPLKVGIVWSRVKVNHAILLEKRRKKKWID